MEGHWTQNPVEAHSFHGVFHFSLLPLFTTPIKNAPGQDKPRDAREHRGVGGGPLCGTCSMGYQSSPFLAFSAMYSTIFVINSVCFF